jgi:FKBP-type peptidyl-prolyl cis-trans isomerase
MVLGVGVEPTRPNGHQHLKLACLPFHHPSLGKKVERFDWGPVYPNIPTFGKGNFEAFSPEKPVLFDKGFDKHAVFLHIAIGFEHKQPWRIMKYRRIPAIAAAVAALFSFSVHAQDIPDDVREKLSYQQGYSLGQQLMEQVPEEQRALFIRGFKDVLEDEVDEDQMLYASGAQSAMQAMQQGADAQAVLRGIQNMIAGEDPEFSEQEIMAAFEVIQKMQQDRQMEMERAQGEQARRAAANKEAGEAFLRENAAREGVVTTLSGLQYEILEEGEGDSPSATDTVTVHYTGRLLDGTVFDSSVERGEPARFPLNRVIPGWTEGLQLMSPGARFRFWIPANLAYGEQAPPQIGPNQVLDFEVELISIGN